MDTYKEIGCMMARVLERRRDKPKLAVLEYMTNELELCKHLNLEPNWRKMFKESKRIWWDNL